MTASISHRLTDVPVSAVRKLTPYAEAAKAAGVTVLHLNIGDPDIKTPAPLINVLHTWDINPVRYANARGEPALREALVAYYRGLGYSRITPEQLLVTVGGSEAILFTFFGIADPGDEILVFEPFYSNYATCAAFADVRLKAIPTDPAAGFHLPDRETIRSYIGRKTRAILICTPNNPTGTVYTQAEMAMLVALAREHNLFLISDEVYREFIYDSTHISLLSYADDIPDLAIQLDSLSKRFSLCGARIGMVYTGNEGLMKGMIKLAQGRLSGGLIDQIMAARMGNVPQQWLTDVREEYRKRRDCIYSGLRQIPGVTLSKPEGAFYTMVTLPVSNAEDFCIFLLETFRLDNRTVMLAPGAGFYQNAAAGVRQVRIAYVLNTADLMLCMEIIRQGLNAYGKR